MIHPEVTYAVDWTLKSKNQPTTCCCKNTHFTTERPDILHFVYDLWQFGLIFEFVMGLFEFLFNAFKFICFIFSFYDVNLFCCLVFQVDKRKKKVKGK